jgi:hypothetical protein
MELLSVNWCHLAKAPGHHTYVNSRQVDFLQKNLLKESDTMSAKYEVYLKNQIFVVENADLQH